VDGRVKKENDMRVIARVLAEISYWFDKFIDIVADELYKIRKERE
jgi:hypothetical protein